MRGESSLPVSSDGRIRLSTFSSKESRMKLPAKSNREPASAWPTGGPIAGAVGLCAILVLSVWLYISVTSGAAWEHQARLTSAALENTTIELRHSTKVLAGLYQQHQSTTAVLAQTMDDNQKQGAELNHLQQHAGRLSSALQQQQDLYETDTNDLQNRVNQEYQLRRQQAVDAREDRRSAQRQIDAAEQNQAAAEQENQNLAANGQRLAQANDQLAQQANAASASAQSWKNEADNANLNAQRLQNSLTNSESLNVALQSQLNNASAEERRLRGTMSRMESETSELHRRIDSLDAELRQRDSSSNNSKR